MSYATFTANNLFVKALPSVVLANIFVNMVWLIFVRTILVFKITIRWDAKGRLDHIKAMLHQWNAAQFGAVEKIQSDILLSSWMHLNLSYNFMKFTGSSFTLNNTFRLWHASFRNTNKKRVTYLFNRYLKYLVPVVLHLSVRHHAES